MNLMNPNPFREMEYMFNRLHRSSHPFSTPLLGNRGQEELMTADWTPSVDITESDSEYTLKAELPEIKKEDINISVENNLLCIEGERTLEKSTDASDKQHRIERFYGRFSRSFSLPQDADEKNLKADYREGMLYLHIPKQVKKSAAKKNIPIQ